jgi:diguanylate cyclase (GGDEF)-like protein
MSDFTPFVPPEQPDALDDSTVGAPSSTSNLDFLIARQRDRMISMALAAGTAFAARWAGLLSFDVVPALAVLAVGALSALGFVSLYERRARSGRKMSLTPWWLVTDVIFVSGLVWLTGGITSVWCVWYVACVGRAALMRGLGQAGLVAGASTLAYVGVLAAMGQIHGFDAALVQALLQMAVVFGGTALLLVGTDRLRESELVIKRLHAEDRRRVAELERVSQDLESTSALLRDLTLTDSLTGARNRRFFRDYAVAAGERRAKFGATDRRALQHSQRVGVLLVDLDRFKEINDRWGHPVGDSVLKHVARTLKRCLRDGDTLVRWGGDEFLILVSGADAGRTSEVATRIVDALRLNPYEICDDQWLSLTCSLGWSHVDWHQNAAEPLDAAVEAADVALYEAKHAGRDRVVAARADLTVALVARSA